MAKEEKEALPLIWNKLQILSGLIASVLVPLVVALVGQSINKSIQENEIRIQYMKLALDILQEPPRSETENLRNWAIETLNYYSIQSSGIALGEAEQDLRNEQLKFSAASVLSGKDQAAFGFREGKYYPYKDVIGLLNIGFEHAISPEEQESGTILLGGEPVSYENGLTLEQAEQLLDQDLEVFRQKVDELVTVPLTDNRREVLALFAYNIGIGALQSSTLLRELNAGNYDAVPDELRRWTRAGGSEIPELIERREREIELWLQE